MSENIRLKAEWQRTAQGGRSAAGASAWGAAGLERRHLLALFLGFLLVC